MADKTASGTFPSLRRCVWFSTDTMPRPTIRSKHRPTGWLGSISQPWVTRRFLPSTAQDALEADQLQDDVYILGLVNTIYSIGAIISGWFVGGPIVSYYSSPPTHVPRYSLRLLGRLSWTPRGHGPGLLDHNCCHYDADVPCSRQPCLLHGRAILHWFRSGNSPQYVFNPR